MAKYSRVERYKDLRDQIQNDTEETVQSNHQELSRYERRLNRIDSQNFAEPTNQFSDQQTADPISARRHQATTPVVEREPEISQTRTFNINSGALRNENYTGLLNNEYLNEYIKEVKQYNVDQGNAMTTNTDLDILRSIRGEAPAPRKPYPNENATPARANSYANTAHTNTYQTSHDDGTMDIPFFSSDDDDNNNLMSSQTMSREDIANEVKNLIRGQGQPQDADEKVKNYSNNLDNHLAEERTARQRLLNETSQMRAQLDDYEDNLTEVSDKMQHTNHILNVVLVVLIVVLVIVLLIVIYWILQSRGVF